MENDRKENTKRRGFWQISTGTVLGAVITALAGSLLGAQAPWFIERLTLGSRQPVSFTIESVFSGTPGTLDRSRWHVDEETGFAVAKPPQDWFINKSNPAAPLTGPSMATIPFYHFSISQMSPLAAIDKFRQDDIVTTEIRPAGVPHQLEFNQSSSIDSIPLKLNPASSDDFIKRTLTMTLRMEQALSAEKNLPPEALDILEQRTSEGREQYSKLRAQMEHQFENVVAANWPSLEYSDNVTITTFKTSLVRGDPMFEPLLQGKGLTIFTAFGLVSLANPELFSLNTKSVSYSNNNLAMLLDTSVELKNFTFDKRARDESELRRYVLIVLADDKTKIFVVVWRNLVGLGATYDDSEKMKKVFESFKLLHSSN